MGLFRESFKCPACGNLLEEKPKRKQICSHCGNAILVRDGKLVTEEGAFIIDWLMRLEYFGVSRKDFNQARDNMERWDDVVRSFANEINEAARKLEQADRV